MNEHPSIARRVLVALFVAITGLFALSEGAEVGATTPPAPEPNLVLSSSPEDGSSRDVSPDTIFIGFESELGDASAIEVDCEGESVDLPSSEIIDETGLSVDVTDPLPSGTCVVRWTSFDTDGAANGEGIITFVVANDSPQGAVDSTGTGTTPSTGSTPADGSTPGAGTDDGSDPAASPDPEVVDFSVAGDGNAAVWLGRFLSTLGIATLFGALFVITAAWPEGVEYLVTISFLRVAWVVAVIGTVLFTAAAAGAVTPDGGGSAFSPGTWLDLLDAGWSGRAVLARLLLILASAWVAFRPDRAIDPTTQLAALGIPALCTAMLGVSRTVGDLPALGVVMGVLHALAMAVWLGGVILLARVVLSGPGEEDLVHAVRGFGRVSTPAIAVTILTGVVQMIRLDGGALFSSGHGRVVVLKAVVVAVMIFVAISARQFVAQRLNRAQQMSVPLADRLRRAFGAEAGIGVLTLVLSAWLLAFVPPNVGAAPSVDYAELQTHLVESADLEVDVSLTDDMVGSLVGLEVEVKSPPDGLSGLAVVLTAPTPNDLDLIGYIQPIPLTGEGVAVRDASVGLPINVAGDWGVQVEATLADGTTVSSAPQLYRVLDAEGSTVPAGEDPAPVQTVTIPEPEPTEPES